MATIRKRGKTYLVQVSGGCGPDGKRVRLSRTVRGTKREAERVAVELEADVRRGTHVEPTRETVAQYFPRWLAALRLEPTTRLRYSGIIARHITPKLGSLRLADVRATDIHQALADWFEQGLSPSTVHQHHAILQKGFRQALEWGDLARNPMLGVHAPRVPDPKTAVMDPAQLKRFLAALTGHRHRIPLLLMAFSGMRVGEVLGLRWADIAWDSGTIHVRQQWNSALHIFKPVKSYRSERPIDMPALLWPILREHQTAQLAQWVQAGTLWQGHDLVVCNEAGEPVSANAIRHAYARLIAVLKLPANLRPHDLRHGMASMMLQDGVPIKVVQERLGHATPAFTLHKYGHVLPGMQREAAERFAAGLLPADPPSTGSKLAATPESDCQASDP